jgi:hypothetical protein
MAITADFSPGADDLLNLESDFLKIDHAAGNPDPFLKIDHAAGNPDLFLKVDHAAGNPDPFLKIDHAAGNPDPFLKIDHPAGKGEFSDVNVLDQPNPEQLVLDHLHQVLQASHDFALL